MTTIPDSDLDTSWINNGQAVTDAAAILKIPDDGADAELLQLCAEAAGIEIALWLDRNTPIPNTVPGTPPAPLRFAHSFVTVEKFRRKDAAFGVLNSWSPDNDPGSVDADSLAGVKKSILGYRQRWGIG